MPTPSQHDCLGKPEKQQDELQNCEIAKFFLINSCLFLHLLVSEPSDSSFWVFHSGWKLSLGRLRLQQEQPSAGEAVGAQLYLIPHRPALCSWCPPATQPVPYKQQSPSSSLHPVGSLSPTMPAAPAWGARCFIPVASPQAAAAHLQPELSAWLCSTSRTSSPAAQVSRRGRGFPGPKSPK